MVIFHCHVSFRGGSLPLFFWWKKTFHVVSSHLQVTVEPGWVFLHGFKNHAKGLMELQICWAVFCLRIVKRRVNSSLKTNISPEKSMVGRWHFLSKWSLFGRQCLFSRGVSWIRSSFGLHYTVKMKVIETWLQKSTKMCIAAPPVVSVLLTGHCLIHKQMQLSSGFHWTNDKRSVIYTKSLYKCQHFTASLESLRSDNRS